MHSDRATISETRDAVCEAVEDGWSLGEIEAVLLNRLTGEQAAALWLYAWALAEIGAAGAERRTTRALESASGRPSGIQWR